MKTRASFTGTAGLRARRFGAALGVVALCLQMLLSSWDLAVLPGAAPLLAAAAEHAICLAPERGGAAAPSRPADQPPAQPLHHHMAACCLQGHTVPICPPPPGFAFARIAFAAIPAAPAAGEPAARRRQMPGGIGARAPPVAALA